MRFFLINGVGPEKPFAHKGRAERAGDLGADEARSWTPTSFDSVSAMTPEPTTVATSSAVPSASATSLPDMRMAPSRLHALTRPLSRPAHNG